MMEYLYAGSVVIKPDWLKYYEFEAKGISYYTYSDFGEISGLIRSALKDIDIVRDENKKNKRILAEFNSWEAVFPAWRNLYD